MPVKTIYLQYLSSSPIPIKTHKFDEKYNHVTQSIFTVSDLILEFKKRQDSPLVNTYYQLIKIKTPGGNILSNDESIEALGMDGTNEEAPLEIVKMDQLNSLVLKQILPDYDKVIFNQGPPSQSKGSIKKEIAISAKQDIKVDSRLFQLLYAFNRSLSAAK